MLEHLKGRLQRIDGPEVVLDIHGVGVRVRVSAPEDFARHLGTVVTLYTALDIQPRGWTVYGFRNQKERQSFEELWGIPGIGAGTALRLMPHLAQLRRGGSGRLPELPGIGPAKRQRLLRWLKRPPAEDQSGGVTARDLRAALGQLGVPPREARLRAVHAMAKHPEASLDQLLRFAIKR